MTPKLRNFTVRKQRSRGYHKRQQLWQAMRILRTFTAYELQAVTEAPSRGPALTFCAQLRRAGYLGVQYGCRRAREPARYRLLRDTGPQVPWVIHRGAAMYDPNTDREHAL